MQPLTFEFNFALRNLDRVTDPLGCLDDIKAVRLYLADNYPDRCRNDAPSHAWHEPKPELAAALRLMSAAIGTRKVDPYAAMARIAEAIETRRAWAGI